VICSCRRALDATKLIGRAQARYKTNEELAAENEALEEYKQKMNSSIQFLRTSLLGKTRADLEVVLDAADKVRTTPS
jgi:hypothetical protein